MSGCFIDRTGTATRDGDRTDTGVPGLDAGEDDAGPAPDSALPDAARPDSGPVLEVPGPPGTPTFSSIRDASASVAWAAPVTGGPAESYDLERARDVLGLPDTFMSIGAGLGSTSFDDGGLAPATSFWYRVRAANAAGLGPYSAPARVTTTAPPRSVTRVQFAQADGWNPTVMLGTAPIAGNLLVAVAFHRTNIATPSIPGWTVRIDTHFRTDDNDRRGLAVLTRVAQSGDPRDVQITWSRGGRTSQLIVQELTAGPGATWTFEAQVSRDSGDSVVGSIALTSSSVAPGDLLLIGAAGARNGFDSAVAFSGLANMLSYSDFRSAASGFALVTSAGPQTTTASWLTARRATAGLVVFRVD